MLGRISVPTVVDLIPGVGGGVAPIGGPIAACLLIVPLVCLALAFVGVLVPLILFGLALVGQAVPLVCVVVALVGQAFAFVKILLGPRAGFSTIQGTLALGGCLSPVLSLDGSVSSVSLALGVGLAALFQRNFASLYCLLPVLGDLLPDRPHRVVLFIHRLALFASPAFHAALLPTKLQEANVPILPPSTALPASRSCRS